jgi:release factor glutamine methyltransferase
MQKLTIEQALRAPQLPAIELRILLAHALDVDHAHLIAHGRDALGDQARTHFDALCARRLAGEPVAYLTGMREFYGVQFEVSPAVLIPRPETEVLVDLALERIQLDRIDRILDLGTGSGCIALSIVMNRPLARVTATEVSAAALAVARDNARRLDADLELRESDWYSRLGGERFDLIVSNPPYVAAGDPHLSAGDLRFEPGLALTDGSAGLASIEKIVAGAPAHLAPQGWLLFEHGYDQAAAARDRLAAAGFRSIRSWRDLAGIERVSGGRIGNGLRGTDA